MNFFRALFHSPVGLTEAEEAYIDAVVDDVLQEPNPSDVVTVLSFLQEGHRMTPWLSDSIHHPVEERMLAQRFLQHHDQMAMPSYLSLHSFML